ncbi:MAG: twin-arginine translocase subunit TatC [Acidobacteria bacterium]|nr:twin-arginine translocase subunit TatC [Acidobacteriota bacterium]
MAHFEPKTEPPRIPPPEAESPVPGDEQLASMSLVDHLEELRRRILRSVVIFAVAFFVCWSFHREIFDFLKQPIEPYLPGDQKLSFFSVSEPFLLYFKTAALAAIFLASPFLLAELWGFVSPGLYRRERKLALPFILASTFFFLCGGAFAYFVAFPFAVEFLLGMGEEFQPVIAATQYLRFLMTVILGLGLMFELPIVLFLLSVLRVVSARFLLRHFRWAVLLIFIAAAVITPTPDVVNLCLFAVPTIGLYLLGVAGAWLVERGRRKQGEADAAAGEPAA